MSISRVKQKAQEADEMIAQLAKQAEGADPDAASAEQPNGGEQPSAEAGAEVVDLTTAQPASSADSDDHAIAQLTADNEALRQELKDIKQWKQTTEGIVRSRDERIDELRDIIANMQAAPAAPAEPEQPSGPVFTAEEETQFGSDMIDLVRRIARDEAKQEVERLADVLDGLEGKLQNVSKQATLSAEESFQNKLGELSPGWEDLDADPAFSTWLQESPTRQNMFATAVQNLDAAGVSEVMNLYKSLHTQQQAAQQQAERQTTQQLEAQVSPGKSRKAAPPAKETPEEKIWTRSEIADVYKQKKQYTAEEFAALEREIAAAQRDQRVDYSR